LKTSINKGMTFRFTSGKKLSVLLHVIGWTIFIILPYYLLTFSRVDSYFLYRSFVLTGAYVLIFYLNYSWLVPKFFINGNKRYYFLSAIVLIIVFYFVIDTSNRYFLSNRVEEKRIETEYDQLAKKTNMSRPPKQWHIYNYLFTSFLITGFSLGLRVTNKYIENEEKRKELEKERLNSELAFLKNQISPHFFFNTLNNIYSLVEINTNDAQKSILQLSKLMRYLLYESEQGNTVLSREIDFMKNYIDLMRLRLSNKIDLQVEFPETPPELKIPPLLFIPFIENAFKHGIRNREKSFIFISMKVNNSEVFFTCKNSRFDKSDDVLQEESGIGLDNVKKRLSLLFSGKHKLSVKETADSFGIDLQIDLHQMQHA
jgi:two-component system, LytTR family, sensor kinase